MDIQVRGGRFMPSTQLRSLIEDEALIGTKTYLVLGVRSDPPYRPALRGFAESTDAPKIGKCGRKSR
jgi:hypothetical protein